MRFASIDGDMYAIGVCGAEMYHSLFLQLENAACPYPWYPWYQGIKFLTCDTRMIQHDNQVKVFTCENGQFVEDWVSQDARSDIAAIPFFTPVIPEYETSEDPIDELRLTEWKPGDKVSFGGIRRVFTDKMSMLLDWDWHALQYCPLSGMTIGDAIFCDTPEREKSKIPCFVTEWGLIPRKPLIVNVSYNEAHRAGFCS